MDTPYLTISQALATTAARFGERPCLTYFQSLHGAPRTLTFAELHLASRRLAGWLARRTHPGDAVTLALPTGPESMVALHACLHAGVAAAPIYPPRPKAVPEGVTLIRKIATLTRSRFVLTLEPILALLQSDRAAPALLEGCAWTTLDSVLADPDEAPLQTERATADAPALVLFTSGSTGAPKGAVLTQKAMLYNFAHFVQAFALTENDPAVTWLPNCHIAGIYTRLTNTLTGGETVVFPPALFLERPTFWLEIMSRYRAAVTAAPNFAYDILRSLPEAAIPQDLDLSAWKMAVSGGEIVRPDTRDGFAARFAKFRFSPNAMHPYYGLTETLCSTIPQRGSVIRIRVRRAALEDNRVELADGCETEETAEFLSNGQPLGDTQVLIVDPMTRVRCLPDTVGEIWVGGTSVTPGYWMQPELNRETVEARLEPTGEGPFVRTGDLGFLREGELFITGRLKELIIIRGKNFYPADLETTALLALRTLGVAACAAFGFEEAGAEKLALAIEPSKAVAATLDESAAVNALQVALSRTHGMRADACIFLRNEPLPRTSTGKIQRAVCRQRFLAKQWVQASPDEEDTDTPAYTEDLLAQAAKWRALPPEESHALVERYLVARFAQALRLPLASVCGASAIAALGLDSLSSVRLLARTKEELRFEINFSWLFEAETIRDLAGRITAPENSSRLAREPIDYQQELESMRPLLPLQNQVSSGEMETAFLTGATGFLGSYLLRDLLTLTSWNIRCLVRAGSREQGRERLLQKLKTLPGWREQWTERLTIIPGRLEQPEFGLAPDSFDALCRSVTTIFHNGANVNFVAPYAALRAVNVGSNITILTLATRHGIKPVHYVSTAAVFNGPERDRFDPIRETDFLPAPDLIFSGYAQTKWVSEAMWRTASAQGVPVAVYRPGLVSGDSTTGYWHTDDFLCRFLKGCIQMGRFPDLPIEIEMDPVDFTSRAIVTLARDPESLGQSHHLVNPQPILLPALVRWLRENGYAVELEPSRAWHERIANELPDENALYPLHPFLLQEQPGGDTILEFFGRRRLNLDFQQTAKRLARASVVCPPVDDRLLSAYLSRLTADSFLPHPTRPVR